MIHRYMFLGYYTEKDISVSKVAYYSSISYFNDMVLVYVETKDKQIPYDLVSGNLKPFPDGRHLMPLLNVFQYSPSEDESYWQRDGKTKPVFWIAKLKRDEITKYIFHHYQMMHEGHRATNKYGIIFYYDDILVMYKETPDVLGIPNPRTLPENNLPWFPGNMILACGIPWDGKDDYWHVIE